MQTELKTPKRRITARGSLWAGMVFLVTATGGGSAAAADVDGFTEPYRTVNVAASESGVVARLFVQEGQPVKAGDPLLELDNDVLLAALEVARAQMEARGPLDAAAAELQLRELRAARLQELRPQGHASQQELDQALTELAAAQAHVLAARENLHIRRLDFLRLQTQIERRTIRAPLDGVVAQLHKVEGEFAALNDPVVLTVVQLDRLLAVFSVDGPQAKHLRVGQKLRVQFISAATEADGVLELLSPVTDAESGTVRIKVRIDNADGRFRSGERCSVAIPNVDVKRVTRSPGQVR